MVPYERAATGENKSAKHCCNAVTSTLWASVRWSSQWREVGMVEFSTSSPNLSLSITIAHQRSSLSLFPCFEEVEVITYHGRKEGRKEGILSQTMTVFLDLTNNHMPASMKSPSPSSINMAN